MNTLKLIFFIILTTLLFANKVEITSDSMRAVNLEKEVHFIGNVTIKQQKSQLHGDKVIVYFDEKNETKMYEAIGSVTFAFEEEKSAYTGSAKRVVYYPAESKYVLKGKAVIDDLINKRYVQGDLITLDMTTGNAQVEGNRKKPVKFIFEMEQKQ